MYINGDGSGMIGELWARQATMTRQAMMMPFDTLAWWQAVAGRKPPEWSSPNEVVLEAPFALLRDFSTASTAGDDGDDLVPTLIFPPMSGHASTIVDMAGQSQVQLCLAQGLSRVYAFDWLSATRETTHVTIDDRLAFIGKAVEAIAGEHGKVNLVGNCQGGWEASIWAALNPGRVNTLILAGSPIDTSVDIPYGLRGLIRWFQTAGETATAETLRAMVAFEGGVHRGLSQLSLFMMKHPAAHQLEHLRLYSRIREPEAVARFSRFYDWYFYPVDMSAALFQWCVPHLFVKNELYEGRLEIGGRRVDLRSITAPVFLLAGEQDDITPPRQQLHMANVVGSERVEKYTTPGGHLGVFIGHRSQATVWPQMLSQVRELSGSRTRVP
jgi:poly(3-hydroxyalkanoate) synthetase